MKKVAWSVIIGSGVGAMVAIAIGFLWMRGSLPFTSTDVFGFVITTLAIIVAVFAVIGAVAIVNTWNDITAKSEAMVKEQVDKYTEEQAKLMEERKKMLQEAKEDFLTVIDKAEKSSKDQTLYIWTVGLVSSWLIAIIVSMILKREKNR